MSLIRVQGPVSRSRSLRMHLATLAWARGVETFFLNQVPFSFGTGAVEAANLVALVRFRAARVPLGPIRIWELGAGLGLLSRHCLDQLQRECPEVYARCVFEVSDAAPELVARARNEYDSYKFFLKQYE